LANHEEANKPTKTKPTYRGASQEDTRLTSKISKSASGDQTNIQKFMK